METTVTAVKMGKIQTRLFSGSKKKGNNKTNPSSCLRIKLCQKNNKKTERYQESKIRVEMFHNQMYSS